MERESQSRQRPLFMRQWKVQRELWIRLRRLQMQQNVRAESVAEVTQGVDQISSVVQTNSATAGRK